MIFVFICLLSSLSMIISRAIHVAENGAHSFLWVNNIYIYIYIYTHTTSSLSIHLLIDTSYIWMFLKHHQFSSVAQSCLTLCDPMNCSTPGLPVHHQLLEFIQTHVHRVGDVIQPSHPLSSPFPPAPNPSQRQSLFQ